MSNETQKPKQTTTFRHHLRVVAVVVLVLSLLVLYKQYLQPSGVPGPLVNNGEVATSTTSDITGPILPEAEPTTLRIPSVNVNTTFEAPLGLRADQTIEVPESFEEVAWYQHSPTPGELGPSVVLGHVDSYEGPAVFFSLGQLTPGDPIYIDRVDGTTATFTVSAVHRYEQEGFPTELVYGDLDHAGLRLITCSGTYDRNTLRYSHNLVVYAKLVD